MINLLLLLSFLSAVWPSAQTEDFSPVTKGISFKANYEVSVTEESKLFSSLLVHEFYSTSLSSSKISITEHRLEANNAKVYREYLYFGNNQQRDIEISNDENQYEARILDRPIESFIYKLPKRNGESIFFDPDDFIEPDRCLRKVKDELSYIRGLSKILHLIECHKDKFTPMGTLDYHRVRLKRRWQLEHDANFGSNSTVRHIRMEIRVDNITYEDDIKSRRIPSEILIDLDGRKIELRINLYRFEVIQNDVLWDCEHHNSISNFMLPSGIGLNASLKSLFYPSGNSRQHEDSTFKYSFQGSLRGYFPLVHPLEISVSHDEDSGRIAYESTLVDPMIIDREYRRLRTRVVFDTKSNVSFHIMPLNSGYSYDYQRSESNENKHREYRWTSCITNEYHLDLRLLTRSRDVLSIDGSLFMGHTFIRGIACYVFEKELIQESGLSPLPVWLNLGVDTTSLPITKSDRLYITIYKRINGFSMNDKEHNDVVRISFDVIRNRERYLNFFIDIYHFEWSVSGNELERDIDQMCLRDPSESNHLEVSITLKPKIPEPDESVIKSIEMKDLRSALAQTLGLSEIQETALTHRYIDGRLYLHFKAFELSVHEGNLYQYNDIPDDDSTGSLINGWSVGFTGLSVEDCKLRLAHTITQTEMKEGIVRYLMFCQDTLHCIIGNDEWKRQIDIGGNSPTTEIHVPGEIHYPGKSGKGDCRLYSYGLKAIPTSLKSWSQDIVKQKNKKLKIEYQKPEGKSPIEFITEDVNVRFHEAIENSEMIFRLKGLAYSSGSIRVQRTSVNSLTECEHRCLMDHQCASFSFCHHKLRINPECLLSSLEWSDPKRLVNLPLLNKGQTAKIKAKLYNKNETVEIDLLGSKDCNLHVRHDLTLFKLGEKDHLQVEKDKSLVANSANDCAKLCLDRARVLNSIAGKSDSDPKGEQQIGINSSVCTRFLFSSELDICMLEPWLDDKHVLDLDESSYGDHLAYWIRAKQRAANETRNFPSIGSGEFDSYNLIAERIFIAHPGKRLEISEANKKLQLLGHQGNVQECALQCLTRKGCSSFDVEFLNHEHPRCILNALSLSSLSIRSNHRSFQMKISNDWTHYEPSELALYFVGSDDSSKSEEGKPKKPMWRIMIKIVLSFTVVIILICMFQFYLKPILRRNNLCSCSCL